MLSTIEKVIFLQNVDVFAEVPTRELAFLAAIAEEILMGRGEVVYSESDPSDGLYIVLEGSVKLHRDDKVISTADEKGAFGTWALFDETPRLVTATITDDARLLRIAREDFYNILADHVRITEGIFKTLVRRLRGLADRFSTDKDVKNGR